MPKEFGDAHEVSHSSAAERLEALEGLFRECSETLESLPAGGKKAEGRAVARSKVIGVATTVLKEMRKEQSLVPGGKGKPKTAAEHKKDIEEWRKALVPGSPALAEVKN